MLFFQVNNIKTCFCKDAVSTGRNRYHVLVAQNAIVYHGSLESSINVVISNNGK